MTTATATRPLTFGDTFTLPSTGDLVWTIQDTRPTSYYPLDHLLTVPGHASVARAVAGEYVARYDIGQGWYLYRAYQTGPIAEELNALNVQLDHRTEDEWRQRHLDEYAQETRQAISTVVGLPQHAFLQRELVTAQEAIAHITATAAVTAAKQPRPGLYEAVYEATLANL